MKLISGKNKDMIPYKAVENIILVLKITSGNQEQLYKLIPKIDIINKIDGISTKVSATALAKISGENKYVVK